MNYSSVTPEIIATKIWEWHWDEKLDCWVSPEGHRFFDVTFKEQEWTGPLLAKAAEVSDHYDLGRSGDEYSMTLWRNSNDESDSLDMISSANSEGSPNYAIAGAILEAIGE